MGAWLELIGFVGFIEFIGFVGFVGFVEFGIAIGIGSYFSIAISIFSFQAFLNVKQECHEAKKQLSAKSNKPSAVDPSAS
jgi:hypothetical protein